MKALHFGAGNIGRGLIGDVLSKNQFNITFVDTNENVIKQINEDSGYTLEFTNEEESEIFINHVMALNGVKEAAQIISSFPEFNIITTSVGADNLNKVAKTIKQGLLKSSANGQHMPVLANENIVNATDILKEEIKKISSGEEWDTIERNTSFLNTAIDRQCMPKMSDGKSIITVEPYHEWVIECNDDNNLVNQLSQTTVVNDLKPYLERKLYIVNAEHAAFAYLGSLLGFQTIQQAGNDDLVLNFIRKYLYETADYFMEKYNMLHDEISKFIEKTIERHTDENLNDSVHRVAKDPIRKLNKKDRLVAPMLELEMLGADNRKAKTVIASAYLYQFDEDPQSIEIQRMIKGKGLLETIMEISELPEKLAQEITEIVEQLKKHPAKFIEEIS